MKLAVQNHGPASLRSVGTLLFSRPGLFEAGSLDRSKDEARAASAGRSRPFLMIYVNKVENLAGGPTRGPPFDDVVRPPASGSRTSSILIPLVATPTPASLVRTVFDLGIFLLVFRRSCLLLDDFVSVWQAKILLLRFFRGIWSPLNTLSVLSFRVLHREFKVFHGGVK